MPSRPFAPQTVLVTGASSGIGRATVARFAERGANLVLVARGRSSLEEAAADARAAGASEVVVSPADVTDDEALRKAVDDGIARFGRLDVVVHAAQVMAYGRIEDLPREVFERVVDTAVEGTANVARAVLPVFRSQDGGHLVVVSSLLAEVAAPYMGAYVTAKWAQLGLVRVLQQETRDVAGIHVSAVACGGVSTPIYSQGATYLGRGGRPPFPVYAPERIARRILARLDRPRRFVHAGVANPLVVTGFRLLPGVYDALVGPLLRTLALAREEVPPTEGNVFVSRPEGNATHGKWRAL